MPGSGRGDDGAARDSLVLLLGHVAVKGRAVASALQRAGYVIEWETSTAALRTGGAELPPAAVLVDCPEGRDTFGTVRWLRTQRTYAQSLVFALVRDPAISVGDGIAAGADDVIDPSSPLDDVLDRIIARISRARRSEERALFDCVTQVRNRRYALERLPAEVTRALSRQGQVSCAVLDLDGVEAIRKANGRSIAERTLERFGFSLRSCLRSVDVACRFDDRTFAVLLPGLDATAAAIALAPVGGRNSVPAELALRLRVTRAFAEGPRDGTIWDELFDVAERRLVYGPRASGEYLRADLHA